MNRAARSQGGVLSDLKEPVGLLWPKALSEEGTTEGNPCGLPSHPGGEQPGWLWPGYHCTLDKQLKRDYGWSCAAYWRLFDRQGGVCDRCKKPPGGRRLVVDEDDTAERIVIRGLLHFACNRKVDRATARYVLDPTGPKDPFYVSADRAKRRRQRLNAKRKGRPATVPTTSTDGSYADKVKALQASEGRD